ncbi:Trans-1,2-dihydrobenzene-1,2-diol dehydrogenase [Hypsibius exemplaris]|uniref:Trans-1,2-dihydrobenzene-1,2-diol dehydrogenase n=1 Tax=Hypsibius exemplaris TaxID=2072580 RepID=A0A9X6RND6_HYPEX|nr:Trans-1,2-dihydrobenzene-1,2-diol dehydrogenase [Hypsibius exemplaris]
MANTAGIILGLLFSLTVTGYSTSVMAVPATTFMPPICLSNLVDLVTCLNSTAPMNTDSSPIRLNIAQRCNSLSATAKCKEKLSPACLAQPSFKDFESIFGFAVVVAASCNSPAGRRNIQDLTECSDKSHEKFEKCFDAILIDKALAFGDQQNGFAAMCCAIHNGQQCYSPTAKAQGRRGRPSHRAHWARFSSFRQSCSKENAFQMSSSKTLRWAICGAGNISHDFALALTTLPKGENQIIAVAGRELAKTQTFADKFGIPKVYTKYEDVGQDADIDVVYVGTFNLTHYEIVKMLLNHGKHVLCEKPITLLLRHTEELFALARTKNRFLLEACWSRFFPAYGAFREELAKKEFMGKPKLVTAQFGLNISHIPRLANLEQGGGSLMDLGIYNIQFAMLVFGNEMPEEIVTSCVKNEKGVDVTLGLILKYKSGGIAQLTSIISARIKSEAVVYCDNNGQFDIKSLTLPYPFWSTTELITPTGTLTFPLPPLAEKTTYPNGQGMRYEIDATRRSILAGEIEAKEFSHQDSLTLARIVDKVKQQIGISYDFIYAEK